MGKQGRVRRAGSGPGRCEFQGRFGVVGLALVLGQARW